MKLDSDFVCGFLATALIALLGYGLYSVLNLGIAQDKACHEQYIQCKEAPSVCYERKVLCTSN
jgi:hypothetical protein